MKRKKIKMINLPPRDTTIPNQNQDNAQLNSDPLLNININTHKTWWLNSPSPLNPDTIVLTETLRIPPILNHHVFHLISVSRILKHSHRVSIRLVSIFQHIHANLPCYDQR